MKKILFILVLFYTFPLYADEKKTKIQVISVRDKRDCVDTPENRFVKHVLLVFEKTVGTFSLNCSYC